MFVFFFGLLVEQCKKKQKENLAGRVCFICVVSQSQGKDYRASFPSEIKKGFGIIFLN